MSVCVCVWGARSVCFLWLVGRPTNQPNQPSFSHSPGRADGAIAPPRILGDALGASPFTITLDAASSPPQAAAETVTVYQSDPSHHPRRCAAATAAVMAYGLRTGAVRLLARGSSERALAKGHDAPIVDIAFGPSDSDASSDTASRALLATVDGAGIAGIWAVAGGGGAPLEAACAALVAPHAAAGAAPATRAVAWHPKVAGLLALSAGPDVLLLDVASVAETRAAGGAAPTPTRIGGGAPSTDGHASLPHTAPSAVTALAFSPSGSHLAAGRDDGSVSMWSLPGGGDAADAVDAAAAARAAVSIPTATTPITGAEFVPLGGRPVLVVAADGVLALVDAVAGTSLASVAVVGSDGAPAPLTALAVGAPPPGSTLPPLAVASAHAAGELVAITLTADGRAPAAAARLRAAVLSASIAPAAPWATLLTVQPDAVNLLTVDAAAAAAAVGAPPRAVSAPKCAPAPPAASAPASGTSSPKPPPPKPAPPPKATVSLTRLLTPSQLMGGASPRLGARAASGDGATVAPPLRSHTASPAPPPHAPVVAAAPPSATAITSMDAAAIAAIVRDEVRAEGARAALAHEAAAARLLDAAARFAADDRAALVVAEHAAMEKVLATVSASVNRDLPAKLVAALGGANNGGGVSGDALAAALSAPPAAAVLQGAVASAVDAALPSALATALGPAFRYAFEGTIVPRFEAACRELFAQVQATFEGGLSEHLSAAGGASAETAASLRSTTNKLTAAVDTLQSDVATTQRAVAAAAAAVATAAARAPAPSRASPAAAADPRATVDALLTAGDFGAALEAALEAGDVDVVASVAARVDASALADGGTAATLSQAALLSLLQQLGSDLDRDTETKLAWVREAALALAPRDASLGTHARPTLATLLDHLKRVASGAGGVSSGAASQARLAVHVVNSLLHQCA